MSTYTQILYHIVFSTKDRENTLLKERREDFFKYIWGVIQNKKSYLYRINAEADHVHILTHIHPSISLSDFIKTIKISSNLWIKENNKFKEFKGWQNGYGAFTCSVKEKDIIIEYIKNQENHPKKENSKNEYIRLLKEAHINFDHKYLE